MIGEKMKKILFVSPTGTLDNGAEISIYHLMAHLAKKGHKVINVAPIYLGEPENMHDEYIANFASQSIETHLLRAAKWWWEDAPGGLPADEETRTYYYRENISRIKNIIIDNEIDLVISNTVNVFQGAVAAACESTAHFWLIHEFPFDEFAYYASKIDFIEEQSDEIYSVDGLLNLELNNLFTSNIRKFVPYSDIEKITLKNGNISRLVCVGRISERKNPLELIKAFSQVNINNLELVFIGNSDGNVQKECQDYINKKNIKNINFVGYMENPWEYFTDKDIFVSSSSLETFGLVYVEALLNGIPTIISDNPGYRSAMKIFEIGQMYELGNVEQLTQVIKEVVSNYDFYKKNSLENLEKVQQRYSVENCYKELVESIETLPVVENKPLRHLSKLLTINPPRTVYNSYLGRVKRKVKKLLKKV